MRSTVLMRICVITLVVISLAACGEKAETEMGMGDFSGYKLTPVEDSEMQLAVMRDGDGMLSEQGYILDNKKTGTWITYQRGERVKTLTNYVNGEIEGITLEFDQRGQITSKAYYRNGQLHGVSSTYKFGREQEVIPYVNGKVTGVVRRFYRNGDIMEEIQYKDGVQDGFYRHFNEDQEMDLKYEYKNGEKISGGIVERNAE